MNKQVDLELSTGEKIKFDVGYKSNSIICDFMNCKYSCNPVNSIEDEEILTDSYTENYIIMNLEKILKKKIMFTKIEKKDKFDLYNSIPIIITKLEDNNFDLDSALSVYISTYIIVDETTNVSDIA